MALSTIDETIDVAVPPERAYALWADFGRFHEFVKGVERVERHGDTIHWVVSGAAGTNEWDATITEERPGEQISWVAPDGPIDTDIRFEPLPNGGTRVKFHEHMHDSVAAKAAAASGFGGRRAQDDLERYRELVEAS